jgi:hypothetical protein
MLPLHVGGDLDPRHIDAVDDHLKTCLSCFREFREYATMRSRLGVLAEERLPEGALEGFAEEVMARIAVGEPGPAAAAPGAPVIRWPLLPRLAAAAALLIVCVAGWRYTTDGALTPLDRPSTTNPLPPSSTVSQLPTPTSPGVIPYGALRMPRNATLSPVPPGTQGLRPPTQEQLSIIQRLPESGVMILIHGSMGDGLEAVDDTVDEPMQPRERQR